MDAQTFDLIDAILLGSLQGITEFLPISSSGHLAVMESLFEHQDVHADVLFNIIVHVATLCSTLVILRKDISNMIKGIPDMFGILSKEKREGFAVHHPYSWTIWMIILATIPTGLFAFVMKLNVTDDLDIYKWIQTEIWPIGFLFIITGIVLWFTKYIRVKDTDEYSVLSVKDSIFIGIAQGFAILQGISRSGMTISTGLYRKLPREVAGRFAFLVSLPAIVGALLLEIMEFMDRGAVINSIDWNVLVIGFVTAFLTGLLALKVLLGFIRQGRLHWFSPYCWLIGVFTLYLVWF